MVGKDKTVKAGKSKKAKEAEFAEALAAADNVRLYCIFIYFSNDPAHIVKPPASDPSPHQSLSSLFHLTGESIWFGNQNFDSGVWHVIPVSPDCV